MAYSQFGYSNYGGYNPMNTYMPQQAPMQTPAITPQPMQSGIMARPVATKDEAAMAQVPFDGNLYIFVNPAADEVYTKQFNVQTGNTDFKTYARHTPESAPAIAYAKAEDLDELRKELAALKKSKKKTEVTNDDE